MDYKKLIGDIDDLLIAHPSENVSKMYLRKAADAIKQLISHGVTVQEWISVKDRLPEPWKQVLIYSRHDFCEVALYIGIPGKWRVTWNHDMLDADSVTHWMPLPEMPKGE